MHACWLGCDKTFHLIIGFDGVLHGHLLLQVLWSVFYFYFICLSLVITHSGIRKKSAMKIAGIIIFPTYYISHRIHMSFIIVDAFWVRVRISVVLMVAFILLLAVLLRYLNSKIV